MKLNFLLSFLLAIVLFTGCSKEDSPGVTAIKISDQKQLTQTVYADDNTGKSDVTFTTEGAWTSEITESTKVKSVRAVPDWVFITPSSGEKAGDYTVRISLSTNFTGEKRSADIRIECNGQIITIAVTQEATTENGEKPEPEPEPSGDGVLTNENTNQSVKLTGFTHDIFRSDGVRITFAAEEMGKETFTASFHNPLQNGKLRSGTYHVKAANVEQGDCEWYKSVLGGYGESGTIKVEVRDNVYTFTFDILTDDEEPYKLTGSFTGVPQYLNKEVKVESIVLDESEKTLEMGESFKLIATVSPENATNKNFTWSTSNADVVVVENGIVQGVGKGTAHITATTEDSNKTATCTVTVNPAVAVGGIEVKPAEITLLKGDYYADLVLTVTPENAYNKNYTWTSSHPDVAEYDGKAVMAKDAGEATITFTTEDGAKTATLKVRVNNRETSGNGTLTVTDPGNKYEDRVISLIEAEHTVISKNKVELVLKDDKGYDVMNLKFNHPLLNGSLATGSYNFVSKESDEMNTVYCYTLYGDMGIFIAGSVNVTTDRDSYTFTMSGVKTSNGFIVNGSYTGKLTYTNEYVEVSSVQLKQSSIDLLLGERFVLQATVLPENAFDKKLTWHSDNLGVAKVDENGHVTAYGIGTATIIVATIDGEKSAVCKVTVNPIPATGSGMFSNNRGQSLNMNRAKQWVNEKEPKEIEIQFFRENSLYNDIVFTLVRENEDNGLLKAGTYASILYFYSAELGVKSINSGTVTVTTNGYEYTVSLDITAEDDIKITGTYTGKIPNE